MPNYDAEELLQQAKDRYELCDDYYAEMYEDCEEDWLFLHGEGQWDQAALNTRSKDGRPCLVLNQMLPYAHQITNDIKQARLAIRVVPVDSKADIDTAEIRAGIIRNIEKQSNSKTVYGTAAMNAVGGGLGWIRVDTDYAGEDTFEQEAYLERVLDFKTIMLDPQYTEVDGSDAEYGFVRIDYTKERFEEEYPDSNAISFHGAENKEEVCVVEYFYKEHEERTLYEIKMLATGENELVMDDILKKRDEDEIPYEKLRDRKVMVSRVYHCVLNGDEVISREEFPSQYIPLVPVIGEEVYVNNKRETHSLIRQGKDAQRMYNYWKSASTEMIALQPKSPFIAPTGSFQSYPDDWANANTENLATLEYDPVRDEATGQLLPPPMRQPPAQGSPTMMQEAIGAREDIRLGLGMPQANMGERTNVVSGIALRTQQMEGDNSTYHFIDNLSSSISQVGRILNDLIPVLYSDRKVMRIIGETGEEENVPVNTPYVKDENGVRAAKYNEKPENIYDLSIGKYDIAMDVGASYSSQRQEMADKLKELMTAQPELIGIVGDLAVEALDLPMAKEIADRLRSQMPPEILGDDPQAAKLQAAAEAMKQMEEQLNNALAALEDKQKNEKFDQAIKAEEQQLDRDKFEVDAEKTRADIRKIDFEISQQITGGVVTEATTARIEAQVQELAGTVGMILDDIENDLENTPPEVNGVEMSEGT